MNCQTAKNANNSNFSSSSCYGPKLLTRTNVTSFPVTLNKRPASRFEDRLDSRARGFLQMLVLLVVIVDHEDLVKIIVEFFSHVRRAFFCILVLLWQNQSLILWLLSTVMIQPEYPMFCILKCFGFCFDVWMALQSNLVMFNNLLLSPPDEWQRTSVFVVFVPSLKYGFFPPSAWVDELFATFPWPWKYIRGRSEAPCLAPRMVFFLKTWSGIDKTSLLFLSNSLVLCKDFKHLPQVQ